MSNWHKHWEGSPICEDHGCFEEPLPETPSWWQRLWPLVLKVNGVLLMAALAGAVAYTFWIYTPIPGIVKVPLVVWGALSFAATLSWVQTS